MKRRLPSLALLGALLAATPGRLAAATAGVEVSVRVQTLRRFSAEAAQKPGFTEHQAFVRVGHDAIQIDYE
jgi:hypothetical protein